MGIPGIVRRPETVPEALDAWRAWAVVELGGEPRLSSLTRPERWEPYAPVRARCRHPTHRRPRRFCSCGVYAVPRPELLAGLGPIAGGAVGQVSLWGRVVEHERGFRAEAAYPARIRLLCVPCLAERTGSLPDVVERVERAGVTVLRPLCREHAPAGSLLRDAREVEDDLCATYAVDLLPDNVVRRIHEGRPEIEASEAIHRRRMRTGRLGALALAVLLSIPVIRAFGDSGPPVPVGSQAPASVAPFVRDDASLGGGSDQGLLTAYPPNRLVLTTARELEAPRCARVRGDRMVEVDCRDPSFNAYAWDVADPREGPPGCRHGTVEVTSDDDLGLLLCWRLIRRPG
jgi:hypothetical protein